MNSGGGRTLSSYKGFTLAEVLVTLGIIGVVSAMTVPTLMQNHQRKTYVTQLHKVYNELQQAFLREMTDKNAINLTEAGLTTPASMKTFLHDYFKVVQDCEDGVAEPCFVNDYKNINGNLFKDINNNKYTGGACAVIASGAAICLDKPSWTTSTSEDGITITRGNVFIDINGMKGPNIVGRDAFYLAVFSDGVLDAGNVSYDCRTKGICRGGSIDKARLLGNTCENTSTLNDYACFGKILNDNWEMNY
ncbi:MAG TPA: type II secretion system protein [Candidatus Stercorousia faecigallinarum]|nr:type II secretion system protein [Candidatus Stercorousia faecigallinarum]